MWIDVIHSYMFDRYDWLAKKSLRAGYFLWTMIAYGLGIQTRLLYLPIIQSSSQVMVVKARYIKLRIVKFWQFCILKFLELLILVQFLNITYRSFHYLCGTKFDGWTWPTCLALHCPFYFRYVFWCTLRAYLKDFCSVRDWSN